MNIPPILLNEIEQGNVVLFLGAGASFGATHPGNSQIPSGLQLADLIAEKYLNESYKNEPLAFVSQIAISQTSLFEVQKFIYDIFEPFGPAEFHKLIPTFRWKSLYTTNYDLIIERSYERNENRVQDISPVFKNTRVQNIFINAQSLPYYKLHGCITNINEAGLPLILSPDQYITHELNRERLFNKLLEEAHDFTFLFAGYNFSDIDFRTILQLLEKEKDGRPRFYMISPGIREEESSFWESKRITSIKSTFKEFMEELNKKISKNVRVLSKAKPIVKTPVYNQFVLDVEVVKPSESFLNFLENDIEYVHSAISSQAVEAKEFYKGFFTNWDPIIRDLDVPRDTTEAILSEVFLEDYYSNDNERTIVILIQGFAGSGKSVVLKRLAWDAAISFDKFCVFYKPNTAIRFDNIKELYKYTKKRIHIFIDNLSSREDELKRLIAHCKKDNLPITVIGTERTNVWNLENNSLRNFIDLNYKIEYINNKEIELLLSLLKKNNSLGYLQGKTKQEQLELLGPKAGKVLLVGLYEATHGKPFREIIKSEYESISTDQAKSLYLTVSILHMLGSYARAGLIARVHGISFSKFKSDFFVPLEFIVFDRKDYKINDYVYETRHPYIAQMIFETILTEEQSRFDEFIRILSYLDIDYDSDRNAFVYLTNAKRLLEFFPSSIFIDNIYKKASALSKNNSRLLQQKAILEIERNHINLAEAFISEANKLTGGDDPIILHTFAEIEYKKAEISKTKLEKTNYLDKAISLCEAQIKKFGPSSFSYHTILKSLNNKLESAFRSSDDPTIERLIKEIEKKFRDAKQAYPYHEFILEAESVFQETIKNSPEAIALLEKAHAINKSSPFIASRLANVLDNNDKLEDALRVIKTTLEHIPGDRDINYSYAMLLSKKSPQDYNNHIYYLRKSFTEGDNRYQAQFWCARALYLNNELDESKKLFKKLAVLSIDPIVKHTPIGIVLQNNKKQQFYGKVRKLESSYGFITRDVYGDDIFVYKYDNFNAWDSLKLSDSIGFNIGFNYKGPVALEIFLT